MSLSELGLYRNTEWKEIKSNGRILSSPLDWNDSLLKDVATFFKGKNISKNDTNINGIHKCIRYGELYTKYKEIIKEIHSRTSLDKSKLFFSKKNDILIPASGETAMDLATASCVLEDNIAISGDTNIIRTNINGIFLSYYLNILKKSEIASLSQGGSVIHLYPKHLKSLKVSIPSIEEQTRIADILTKQEDLIENTKTKIEKLKKQRKYFQQELLSGRLRMSLTNKATAEALSLGLLEQIILNAENEPMEYGTDKIEDVRIDIVEGKQEDFEVWLNNGFDSKIEFYKNVNWKEEKVNGRTIDIPTDWNKYKNSEFIKPNMKSNITAGEGEKNGQYPLFNCSNTQKLFHNKYISSTESILLGTGGLANIHYIDKEHSYSTDVFSFSNKRKELFNLKYVFYFYKKHIPIIESCFQGSGLKHLSKKLFNMAEIIIPFKLEQTLIATILTKSDTLIEKEEQNLKKEQKRFKFFQQELLSGRIRTR